MPHPSRGHFFQIILQAQLVAGSFFNKKTPQKPTPHHLIESKSCSALVGLVDTPIPIGCSVNSSIAQVTQTNAGSKNRSPNNTTK